MNNTENTQAWEVEKLSDKELRQLAKEILHRSNTGIFPEDCKITKLTEEAFLQIPYSTRLRVIISAIEGEVMRRFVSEI